MTFLADSSNSLIQTAQSVLLPGRALGLPSLLFALFLASSFLVLRRGLNKQTRMRAVWRGIFSRKIWRSRSTRLDLIYVLANTFLFTTFVFAATMTEQAVSQTVLHGVQSIGLYGGLGLAGWVNTLLITFSLYMAYEFAYWLDHYLSHKLPFLWEFHKVHHSATVLTPFTNWRVHPVDTIVFFNILSLVIGSVHGLMNYLLGQELSPQMLFGQNAFFLIYLYLSQHLQHSQLWISWGGWAGKIFASPAHHQIHHSNHPRHYNKNLGAGLVLFDWLFGTLHIPARKREALTFGVVGDAHLHSFVSSTFVPFVKSAKHLRALPGKTLRKLPRRLAPLPATAKSETMVPR